MEMEVSLIQAFTPRQVTMGQPGGHHCIAFALKRITRTSFLTSGVGTFLKSALFLKFFLKSIRQKVLKITQPFKLQMSATGIKCPRQSPIEHSCRSLACSAIIVECPRESP